jgi:hypothetical protein
VHKQLMYRSMQMPNGVHCGFLQMEQGTVIATLNIDHEYRRQLYEDNE